MAIRMISVKCPACGATLNIESDRTQAFCTYCGTKVLLHNDNEYVYRQINDAEIIRAETERIIRIKQMEYAEKQRIEAEKAKVRKIILSLLLGILGGLLTVVGFIGGSLSGNPDSGLYALAMVGMFCFLGIGFIWIIPAKRH